MYTNWYLNSFCLGLVPFSRLLVQLPQRGLSVWRRQQTALVWPSQNRASEVPTHSSLGLPGNQEQQRVGLGTAKLWTGVTSHNPPETATAVIPRPLHCLTLEALHILSPLPGTIFPMLFLHQTNSCSFIKSQPAEHLLQETFSDSTDWVGISVMFSCSPYDVWAILTLHSSGKHELRSPRFS